MKAHIERTPENRHHAATAGHVQRHNAISAAPLFADHRAEAVAQRKLQHAITRTSSAQAPGAVVQRAPHRPALNSQVRYQGNVWNVTASALNNPNITIQRGNTIRHLVWATADFTIIRQNNQQDHDLRENDPGAAGGPVDAYAGLSSFDRVAKIRSKFTQARHQALQMIKARALQHVNQASQASLNAITLEDFTVTRRGLNLIGTGKAEEPAEWEFTWVEGDTAHPRRTWTFVIDADNPLPDSSQDPHVGWTVSAAAGSQPAVGNTFGHVWLDHVPVMR